MKQNLQHKIRALGARMDERFEQMERRFNESDVELSRMDALWNAALKWRAERIAAGRKD